MLLYKCKDKLVGRSYALWLRVTYSIAAIGKISIKLYFNRDSL